MKRFSGYFLFLLLLLNVKIHVTSEQPAPIVELSYGKLQGVFIVAKDGTKYEAFMGIPYAKPPIGELRFEEPQPPSNWTGTYNATYPRDYCLQYSHIHPDYTIRGSEDCLYLNLYRPMTNPNQTEPLDVIVYIHGGAFMFFGSRNYKSAQLIKKNFILIAFNYRLGPLGFLSTEDEVVPGNMGLKDQVAVLKWIRDNIGHFGGNPNSVTISGMSAGGASVQFHMLSPLSKGLFSKAISHSGVATNPWALAEASLQKTKQLATSLDCPTENTTDMISCLKSVPGEQIVSKVPLFQSFLYAPFSPFGPVVEPASARNAFLPEDPSLALTNVTTKVPWLVSFTSAEGLYPAAEFIGNEEFLKKLNSNWNTMAPHLLDYNYTAKLGSKDEISEKIRKHYFHDKPIHESPKQLVELLSDRLFESGIAFSIGKYVLLNICQESEKIEKSEKYKILIGRYLKTRNNGCEYTSKQAQVFVYKFSYSGNFTGAKSFNFSDQSYGVNHGDDLLYIFDNKLFDNFATDEDKEMQKRLINVYDTFIRKSNPEFLDGVAIPPVSVGIRGLKLEYSVLNITAPDNTTVMGSFDFGNAIKFWSYLPIFESVSTSGHRGHAF